MSDMSEQAGYRINEPNISSEEIDGEVIIVNLLNGNYYSAQGMGAYVWGRISYGEGLDNMQTSLSRQFPGSETTIRDDLSDFLDKLEDEGLIVKAGNPDETGSILIDASMPEQYATPNLNCYSDMNDLLLLDPVHDVEDEGWPKKKQAWPTANPETNN